MNSKLLWIVLFWGCLEVVHSQESSLEGVRTWTDSTGKYKVQAKFVSVKDGLVTLEKESGQTLNLPISRLSADDQQLIRKALSLKSPAVGKRGVLPDWTTARTISFKCPLQWSIEPESPLLLPNGTVDGAVALGPEVKAGGTTESVVCIGHDRKQGHAILARTKGGVVWMERLDLTTGRSLGSFELPQGLSPIDVDPNATRLVTRSARKGSRLMSIVTVLDISGLEPVEVLSFEPHAGARFRGSEINFAAFTGENHLLLMGNGTLSSWDLQTLRAEWSAPIARPPRLSPGRKYLVLPASSGMYVMESRSGKVRGRLPGENAIAPSFAISDDAKRIAMFAHGRLQVWDCATGERFRDFEVTGAPGNLALDFVNNNYLMIGRSHVVDIERRMTLWRYGGTGNPGVMFDGKFWLMLGGGPNGKVWVPFRLPHPEALKAIEGMKAEDLLVLKPGDKVKLKVQLGFAADQTQQITELLKGRLAKSGFVVSEDAEIVFEAVAGAGQPATIQYEDIRFPRKTSSVNVRENSYYLRFKQGQDVLWQTGGKTDAPPLVLIQRGQTVQSALAPFNGLNKTFFEKSNIPKLIAKPGKHGGAYGISRLTASGIVTTHKP